MSIGYPWLLLTLPAVPLMAWYFRHALLRDNKMRETFAEKGLHASLGLGLKGRRNTAAAVLLTFALALASIAVARPVAMSGSGGETTAGMDVIVALDISDSMAVQDTAPSRLAAAKQFVSKLVNAAPSDRFGLVLFSGDTVVTCPPTLDHDAFLSFLEDADYTRANIPGTAIGEGILSAATRFKKGDLPRAVLVVTDGENTYGKDPVSAAAAAKDKGLTVYTVGAGTASGGRIPVGADFFGHVQYKTDRQGQVVNSALDEAMLKAVANAGGGRYFIESDEGSVKDAAKSLTSKSPRPVKDPFKDAKEYGPWFAFAAFSLLIVVIIL